MVVIGCTSRAALVALAVASLHGFEMFEISPQAPYDRYNLNDLAGLGNWKHDTPLPITYGPPKKGRGGKIRRW